MIGYFKRRRELYELAETMRAMTALREYLELAEVEEPIAARAEATETEVADVGGLTVRAAVPMPWQRRNFEERLLWTVVDEALDG
jgi:hypothetical protein